MVAPNLGACFRTNGAQSRRNACLCGLMRVAAANSPRRTRAADDLGQRVVWWRWPLSGDASPPSLNTVDVPADRRTRPLVQ